MSGLVRAARSSERCLQWSRGFGVQMLGSPWEPQGCSGVLCCPGVSGHSELPLQLLPLSEVRPQNDSSADCDLTNRSVQADHAQPLCAASPGSAAAAVAVSLLPPAQQCISPSTLVALQARRLLLSTSIPSHCYLGSTLGQVEMLWTSRFQVYLPASSAVWITPAVLFLGTHSLLSSHGPCPSQLQLFLEGRQSRQPDAKPHLLQT